MQQEALIGRVIAVCKSPEHGYPTYPQGMITIGMLGIEGDAHSGELRESFTQPGTLKPNDRPISIVSEEVRLWLNEVHGFDMDHGDFNEQIVVEGLGDLGNVPIGTIITFEDGVILEVVDRAYPCTKLEDHNGAGLINHLLIRSEVRGEKPYSKRGILCKVIQPGDLKPGSTVKISN